MKIYKFYHNEIYSLDVKKTKKGYKVKNKKDVSSAFQWNSFFYTVDVALTPLEAIEKAVDWNFKFWNVHKKELSRWIKREKLYVY